MWFRERIDKDKDFYSHEEMLELFERYVATLRGQAMGIPEDDGDDVIITCIMVYTIIQIIPYAHEHFSCSCRLFSLQAWKAYLLSCNVCLPT